MADTMNNKPKLQLGAGFVRNGPGSPATPTKLLINHGKPNFTIQRSPQIDEQRKFPTINSSSNNNNNNNNNNNEVIIKNTKFFGVLNNVKSTTKDIKTEMIEVEETEIPKVTLRRTPTIAPVKNTTADNNDNVPEFILRQRAIQQRLSRDKVLDFENRRSGYFTHVVMSPTSAAPTSYAATMSSPAVNPALEMSANVNETKVEIQPAAEAKIEEEQEKEVQQEKHVNAELEHIEDKIVAEQEKEVQQEKHVNAELEHVEDKIVAREEKDVQRENHVNAELEQVEDKIVAGQEKEVQQENHVNAELEHVESKIEAEKEQKNHVNAELEHVDAKIEREQQQEVHQENHVDDEEVANAIEEVNKAIAVGDVEQEELLKEEDTVKVVVENGHTFEKMDNGIDENNNGDSLITISHTNGISGPQVAQADPSGALGVNFEPKTVVSFAKELGNGENKYPDTVQIQQKDTLVDEQLKDLAHVKFDITGDEHNIQIVPVLKTQ